MKKMSCLRLYLTCSLIFVPAAAFARSGLNDLKGPFWDTVFIIFAATVSIALFVVPISLEGTWEFVGYFVWLQIPIILALIMFANRLLFLLKARKSVSIIVLTILYASLTFITNLAGYKYFVADHSDYFPQEKLVRKLSDMHAQQENPTQAEIIKVLGEPVSSGYFTASSQELPDGMVDTMKKMHLEKSFILSYFEKCRGRNGMEERTYYIYLEPETRRYVASVSYYGSQKVSNKWPHRAL